MCCQDAQHLLSLTGMAHNLSGGDRCGIPSPHHPCCTLIQAAGVLTGGARLLIQAPSPHLAQGCCLGLQQGVPQ